MNSYKMSDGTRIKKSVIDRLVRAAKYQVLINQQIEHGYNFCVDCERSSGTYIDCSHDISVDKCQKEGHTELAWDLENINPRCRSCHEKHDKL